MTARRVTRGWTDVHAGVALCATLAAVAGLLGGLESGPMRLMVLGVAVVCVVVGLYFDGFAGVVIGLLAGTAAVVVKRYAGVWNREQFLLATAIAAGFLVLGWSAGLVGTRLRELVRASEMPRAEVRPAFGSLGLLAEERARPRLDDEITRARAHKRALGVLIIHVRVTNPDLDAAARQAVRRALARLVESLLRHTDVPFALQPDEFGAILPETDQVRGWGVVGPLVEAAGRSTFTDRDSGTRRSIADCAELYAALTFLTDDIADADEMIARARSSVEEQVVA